ncbi:S41 family peptidase [Gracilimonas sp. Q87]|uniref:S41 family peptidase n=1 Tax=Gracilimonas sp. Q87 TaxID=3384766 RepID=UPI0039842AD6
MKKLLLLSLLILLSACEISQSDKSLDRKIENLTAFAKVYGHVKYFHPSDEAMDIDWDKLAVHGVETLKNPQNDRDLKKALEVVFSPIAATLSIHDEKPKEKHFLSSYLDIIGTDTTGLKTIAWQHRGVYLGTDHQPYRSSRTHRNDFNVTRSNALFQYLDSELLSGKQIRFRSSFRSGIENQESKAELILVTENQNVVSQQIKLDKSSSEWVYYEFQADIEENTGTLLVGFQMQGDTDLHIDDLKLEYSSSSSDWTTYPLKNQDFTLETPEGPADWEVNSMGVFEYGVYTDNSNTGNKIFRITSKQKLFDQTPSVGETAVQQISEDLWSEVPLALYGTEDYTLPQTEKSFNFYKNEIDQIDFNHASTNDENLRLANIILAWNIFQHFYPYFDVVEVNWDKVLKTSLRRTLEGQNEDEFLETLQWMVAQLEDGHGVTTCLDTTRLYKAPIKVDELEGNIVVTASQIDEIEVGDIINRVDGILALEELNRRIELVSGSPQLRKHRALNMFAAGNKEYQALFELEKASGETETVEVSRTTTANLFTTVREFDYPAIEMIEDDIYLINLRKITKRVFEENLENLSKAKGIIFDYRNGSNSSFSMFNVVPYLINKEVQSPNWYTPELIYPDRRNMQFDHSTWSIAPKKPFIKANNVILNAPGIVSSGETTMGIIDHYNLATLIGQPTAGTNGNTNHIDLPGGCRIMWTGMKVLKHDESQLHLIGYEPDFVVERSIDAVRSNRDEFLEKALEVIKIESN